MGAASAALRTPRKPAVEALPVRPTGWAPGADDRALPFGDGGGRRRRGPAARDQPRDRRGPTSGVDPSGVGAAAHGPIVPSIRDSSAGAGERRSTGRTPA